MATNTVEDWIHSKSIITTKPPPTQVTDSPNCGKGMENLKRSELIDLCNPEGTYWEGKQEAIYINNNCKNWCNNLSTKTILPAVSAPEIIIGFPWRYITDPKNQTETGASLNLSFKQDVIDNTNKTKVLTGTLWETTNWNFRTGVNFKFFWRNIKT
jgi:hypothetical protein